MFPPPSTKKVLRLRIRKKHAESASESKLPFCPPLQCIYTVPVISKLSL